MFMHSQTYIRRRSQLETYFDRTAADAWAKLTSDAPVGRIRATVRAGRDEMRNTLLDWLPKDLKGKTLLDAGCGTGMLAVEAAKRGAKVTAIDLSQTLVDLARERTPSILGDGSVEFLVGDMLDQDLGTFDHAVIMDSLIHYNADDAVHSLANVASRIQGSILFTYAPRTPLLAAMHTVGKVFPRGNRSPAIVPVAPNALHRKIAGKDTLADWQADRTHRVANGFYISQGLELKRR